MDKVLIDPLLIHPHPHRRRIRRSLKLSLCQQGGVVELNGVADRWLAMIGVCIESQWAMPNSLSMRTNGHNVRGGALGLFQQLGTDLAVKAG